MIHISDVTEIINISLCINKINLRWGKYNEIELKIYNIRSYSARQITSTFVNIDKE